MMRWKLKHQRACQTIFAPNTAPNGAFYFLLKLESTTAGKRLHASRHGCDHRARWWREVGMPDIESHDSDPWCCLTFFSLVPDGQDMNVVAN